MMSVFTKAKLVSFRPNQGDCEAAAKLAAIMTARGHWNVCPTEVIRFALREAVKATVANAEESGSEAVPSISR